MRLMSRFSLHTDVGESDPTGPEARFLEIAGLVERWIGEKERETGADAGGRSPEGKARRIVVRRSSRGTGGLRSGRFSVEESCGSGTLLTGIDIALRGGTIAILCDLAFGRREGRLAPEESRVVIRRPRVIRDILAFPLAWRYERTPLQEKAARAFGAPGGDRFVSALLDPDRALPIVAVTDVDGMLMDRDLPDRFQTDLACLANVVYLDRAASWRLRERLGREWSCYNGALRIYWPGLDRTADPYSHPLWTLSRILEGACSPLQASRRIRDQVRRKLQALSTVAIRPHPALAENVESFRRARIEEGERIVRETRDYQALAEAYAAENVQLKAELERSESSCRALEARLAEREREVEARDREIAALRRNVVDLTVYRAAIPAREAAPVTEAPPQTVAEAVEIARRRFAGKVRFGADVDRGVAELHPTEAQPEKILDYLEALALLSDARRAGDLGRTAVEWLAERGFRTSQESDSVKRNRREQQKRQFDACGAPRLFDLHMKPKDGTSPDRCVRIYFDWDEASREVVVGWVGRHL